MVTLGPEGGGKTSTINTLFNEPFQSDQETTVGASVSRCKVDRHFGSMNVHWQKVTVSFCLQKIPRQLKSELKQATMTFLSAEHSFRTALTKPIPQEVVKEAIDTVNSEDIQDGESRCVVFDISGQEIYYEIKYLFLAEEDIALLCFNASVPLEDPVVPRDGRFKEKAAARGMQSNIELIELSLHSVYVCGNDAKKDFLSPRVPVVLMIGTHAENLSPDDENKIITTICKKFHGKPFMDHLPPDESKAFHFIANSNPNMEVVNHLRSTILKGANPVIEAPRPISYLKFEDSILQKSQHEVRIQRTDAADMARAVGIKGEDKVDDLLQYFTNKGILLYYPESKFLKNEVFVSPDEVSELVCTVITTKSCNPNTANLQHSYDRYNKHAVLEESLFDFMLKQCKRVEDKNIILELLEKFSIAAEIPPQTIFPGELVAPNEGKIFMIPSLLVYDNPKTYTKTENDIVVVYHVPRGFIPETVFNKLLVKTLNWCYKESNNHEVLE